MSYQDKIKANKRAQFKARQQRNRIVDQLNQLHAEQYTDEQIRNAGNNAYAVLAQGQPRYRNEPYTIAEGDTLSTIASMNGTTEADILAANPELKQIKTGMVIKAPQPINPGSIGWQGAAITNGSPVSGGIGLPSNAAFGATSTNPQGTNPYRQSEQGYRPPVILPVDKFLSGDYTGRPGNVGGPMGPGGQNRPQYPPNPNSLANALYNASRETGRPANVGGPMGPGPRRPQTYNTPTIAQPAPAQPVTQQQTPGSSKPVYSYRPPTGLPSTYPGGFRRWVGEEMEQIKSPNYVPNPVVLSYLQKLGLVEKSNGNASNYSGGGYSYNYRRGGGGGRGRGYSGGGFGQGPRRTAFSAPRQFSGLIAWRL